MNGLHHTIHHKINFLSLCVILVFGILILRLWQLQVLRKEYYCQRIKGHSELTVRLPAVRGEILDAYGVPLVENRASLEIDFYFPDIVKAFKEKEGYIPTLQYQTFVHHLPQDRKEPDITTILKMAVLPQLEELGVPIKMTPRKWQLHYRYNAEVPFSYQEDLDFETMARFSEKSWSLPGVSITLRPVRHYVYGALASHLFGYIGMPKQLNSEEAKKYNFYQPDLVGKAQIELAYDKELRGTPGIRLLRRDAHGKIEEQEKEVAPQQGANIYLTIDAKIQYIVEKALRVVGRGAAVVVNPNNGAILAMASVPSFDPNSFIPSISKKEWDLLSQDQTDPLTDRAIGAYAPGSIFKLCTSLAGIRAGIGDKTFTCTGGVQYGDKFMKCWVMTAKPPLPPHGPLQLSDALKKSCNAFFYQYGNAAGINQIDAVGKMLGLGQKTGIPLNNEAPGVIPGPAWLAEHFPQERWSDGYTANTAIGQGLVLTTPLQMAMIGATVANGGIYYQPRLVEKVVSQEGKILEEQQPKILLDLQKQGGFSADQIQKVRLGMWKVVNEDGGTARRARLKEIEVAGKTGTAQFWRGSVKDNHAWFLCFAPYDHPQYVVVVFVQGAKAGGAVAAPIGAKIIEQILNLEKDRKKGELSPLAPAKGNFDPVTSVDFSQDQPTSYGAAETTTSEVSDGSGDGEGHDNSETPDIEEEEGKPVPNNKRKTKAPFGLNNFFHLLGGGRSAVETKGETAD